MTLQSTTNGAARWNDGDDDSQDFIYRVSPSIPNWARTNQMSIRFRFSLRSLLIVLTVATVAFAIVFGWLARQERILHRQRQAVARLEELGAVIGASKGPDDGDEWHVGGMLIGEEWMGTDADFVLLTHLTELEDVLLDHPSIGPEAFEHLAACPHLNEIIVYETSDTKQHVEMLRKLLPEVDVLHTKKRKREVTVYRP